jgi:uncharacterized protein (DUF58 family)
VETAAAPGRVYLQPTELRRLKNLLFVARTIVEGTYAGRHRSRFRGQSVEFADYREYSPGDDISDIDWKAFGRTDRLFVRLFEAQTDMAVYTLLDCSASMAYAGFENSRTGVARRSSPMPANSPAVSKFDYSCYLVAALAYLTVKQGDKVSLGLFRDKLVDFVPPGGTFAHLFNLLRRVEAIAPAGQTRVAEALHRSFAAMKRRGLLVIVSDLLEEPTALFEALNLYRHHRFEIMLFHVLHDEELHLPAYPNVRFLDSETGQTLTTAVPEIREEYQQRIRAHIDALRSGCAARRIDYNLATTSTDYHSVLERYLVERAALGA